MEVAMAADWHPPLTTARGRVPVGRAATVRRALATIVGAVALLLAPAAADARALKEAEPDPTPPCDPLAAIDTGTFADSTRIDNAFLPLVPGTKFVLTGRADGLTHVVFLTVTDLTKVIDGIRTVVLWDRDYADGRLVEAELAFQAQDVAGNVWNLGEYPEEFADGRFAGAPSTWIAGIAGAEAGIHVPAAPVAGTTSYRQAFVPAIDFFDCGQVLKTGARTCVPLGCYDDVLVTNEWSPLDPAAGIQRKYYAAGVGNVRIDAVGNETGEMLRVTSMWRTSPTGLAWARRKALQLEARAYAVSEAYRQTPPAELGWASNAAP
jgi:hypothetical protein